MNASNQNGPNGQGSGFGTAGDLFTKMWTDFASRMAASGTSGPTDSLGPQVARQMRDTFFANWSEACDRYMRSDEFRQVMRESMAAAVELRKQLNSQLGEFQHTMQGASRQDIDRLLTSVSHLEARVTDTFEQLLDRFEELTGRVESLETRLEDASRAAGKPRRTQPASSKAVKQTTKKPRKPSGKSEPKKSTKDTRKKRR